MGSSFAVINIELLKGFWFNIYIFFMTLIMALPLGLVVTYGSMSKFKLLKWLTKTLVWVIRGTPLMLQLFVVLYMPGIVFDMPFRSRMTAALIAFVINYSAYFSEIYRGGIESISKGQYEAGQVLGMTRAQIFFHIILFQVLKRIIPPIGNEIITLVKDTSLARVIAVAEVVMVSTAYTSEGLIWPLFYTGVFFLVFSGILSLLLSYTEKKMDYYKG